MLAVIYHPIYSDLPLPSGHRYPINKYRLLYQHVRVWEQTEGIAIKVCKSEPLSVEDVCSVHELAYVESLVEGQLPAAKMRRIGFPWSKELIERSLTSAGGTVLAAQMALQEGVAVHLSGGYHHAHYDYGSGFCLFNDLVLASHFALDKDGVDKVLIIDSDVHHGDGTATLCANREDIVTLSFHCAKNFPARKPSSDYDVPLERECEDDVFLSYFESVVTMAVAHHQPDLIVYDAGVDIHIDDELGYMNISTEGLYKRDCLMLSMAKEKGIPIAAVVGGGYRADHAELVPLHMQLLHAVERVF
ncbi:histone deacetylase [Vibrio tapetis]|uniref:Histone deacetylase/AcuC/AphA family protein n=1 Tax=Vibrio tapetis subsp. tapetis TaxID=1671868 RepID=A0A2N8ZDS5_9VIBR|nr:histone deacetylase [Vibrio tapetis]SON50062.1 Histone deacetylase/AcuC/AphA family protein [Vibrio tapetis subsp. tapetis]